MLRQRRGLGHAVVGVLAGERRGPSHAGSTTSGSTGRAPRGHRAAGCGSSAPGPRPPTAGRARRSHRARTSVDRHQQPRYTVSTSCRCVAVVEAAGSDADRRGRDGGDRTPESRRSHRHHATADVGGAGLEEHVDAATHVVPRVERVGVGATHDVTPRRGDADVHARCRGDAGVVQRAARTLPYCSTISRVPSREPPSHTRTSSTAG